MTETIEKVFSRDKFSISQYQRDYAWKIKNFEDLWEDLCETIDSQNEQGHYLGTIIASPNKQDKTKFDLIDGQQRMTTIFMFLYVLIHKSESKDIYKVKYLLDKCGKSKLEVAPQNQDFFERLLNECNKRNLSAKIKNDADTQGKLNLCEVFQSILDKTLKLKGEHIKQYLDGLLSMPVIWFEEPSFGRAIRTFQSVNDRGVKLKLLDKLKSLLIYYSNSYCDGEQNGLDDRINEHFGEIFKIFLKIEKHPHISSIGNQQFSEGNIFRYHAGSKKFDNIEFLGHYRKGTDGTYDSLKQEIKKLLTNKEQLKDFIECYIEDLKRFYMAFLEILNCIDTNPLVFKLFLLEKINPYFYNSLIRLKINGELNDELLKLFAKADILFFKLDSSRDATAYNLINVYLNGTVDQLREKLIEDCRKSDIKRAIRILVNDSFYYVPSYHYVFFNKDCGDMEIDSLRELIKEKQITQEQEHIIPESILEIKNETEVKRLGFDNLEDFEKLIDTYGNLLSLEGELNKKASDKDLVSKAKVYKKSKLHFNRCFDVRNFNKEELLKRNEEFEKWLKDTFFKEFL